MLDGKPLGTIGQEPRAQIWNAAPMQEMRRLHAAGRGGEVDICARCCTTIPHPLLVTGSLLLHGKTVRRMLPPVERMTDLAKLPPRLPRPPKPPPPPNGRRPRVPTVRAETLQR